MRASLSISFPPALSQVLDRLARKFRRSRSEILQTALEDFAFRAEFEDLRRRFVAKARREEIFTDEDVFERVS